MMRLTKALDSLGSEVVRISRNYIVLNYCDIQDKKINFVVGWISHQPGKGLALYLKGREVTRKGEVE